MNIVTVYVRGGNILEAISDTDEIVLRVFDVDNLQAEGYTGDEIDKMWEVRKEELDQTIY
jgi:hypothetical protein